MVVWNDETHGVNKSHMEKHPLAMAWVSALSRRASIGQKTHLGHAYHFFCGDRAANTRVVDRNAVIRSWPCVGKDEQVAQRLGASGVHGHLRIRMAGLCYDTPSGEAMPFPVDIPDKTPCALS